MQLTEIWDKARHETGLIVPAVRRGLGAMNSHKGLMGFLALTTIFGAVADRGSPHELLGMAVTAAGWLSLPYCWGRAVLSRDSAASSPLPAVAAPVPPEA
jgi:hypothetical protein